MNKYGPASRIILNLLKDYDSIYVKDIIKKVCEQDDSISHRQISDALYYLRKNNVIWSPNKRWYSLRSTTDGQESPLRHTTRDSQRLSEYIENNVLLKEEEIPQTDKYELICKINEVVKQIYISAKRLGW